MDHKAALENCRTIWIINQYASHLVTRHEELAKTFAQKGYRVAVITSSFHHGRREYIFDEPVVFRQLCEGVTYVYLHSGPSYRDNGARRIFNMMDFCRMVNANKTDIVKKIGLPSFVIASSAPPFVWEVGYGIAKKFKAKFIAEFRDIWPLSLVEIQGVSPKHPLVKLFGMIEKRAYKRSDAVVSTMPYAWQHVVEVARVPKEKVHWMANGISVSEVSKCLMDDGRLPEELEDYLSNHRCCIYIGSIVKSEFVDFLIRGFNKVRNPDIYFAVIGEGHDKEKMQALAAELNVRNIRFFPAIDKSLIPKALSLVEACVSAHGSFPIYRFGLSMYKLNDYLASGKPTVFACDANNIVKDAGHFGIPMGDEEEFARTIEHVFDLTEEERNALKEKAIELIAKEYDYPVIGQRYLEMMESL